MDSKTSVERILSESRRKANSTLNQYGQGGVDLFELPSLRDKWQNVVNHVSQAVKKNVHRCRSLCIQTLTRRALSLYTFGYLCICLGSLVS